MEITACRVRMNPWLRDGHPLVQRNADILQLCLFTSIDNLACSSHWSHFSRFQTFPSLGLAAEAISCGCANNGTSPWSFRIHGPSFRSMVSHQRLSLYHSWARTGGGGTGQGTAEGWTKRVRSLLCFFLFVVCYGLLIDYHRCLLIIDMEHCLLFII